MLWRLLQHFTMCVIQGELRAAKERVEDLSAELERSNTRWREGMTELRKTVAAKGAGQT